jgi:MoxR-like ATPase
VETYEKTGNIVDKDFITAYVNYYREMKYMHELLVKGKIVETGYVKDIIEEAMRVLKKNPPTIVYFHGDFGTGKTTLAIHIAKTRFGKEPIIVSGSKYLDPERFTEEFKIQKLESVDFFNQIAKDLGEEVSLKENASIEEIISALVGKKNDLREKIIENFLREDYIHSLGGKKFNEKEFKDYVDKNKDKIPEQKLKDLDEQLDNLFSNQVQGRYVLGAMYICMKEGCPLIIDEANAISPDVLIAFNDLLTKKIGEKIKVRSDEKEIQIKEGYCIIWTGNTGERYKYARFNDMDPAAYSRIVPIKVEYLPQSREVNNMQQLMERLELDNLSDKTFKNEEEILNFVKESKEKAGSDQIFQVLLLKLLNDRLGAELLVRKDDRYSIFKDLYRLSVGARIIMDMFEGRAENLPKFPNLEKIIGSNDPTVLMKKLKKSNLTMRDLIDNIIGGYLNEGQSMDIEYYAFKFVKKYNMYPEEQAILYAILQKTGMFSPQEGWPDYQKIKTGDQKEALTQFQKMINFDPVKKVKKYKKVNKNGDYVSLLDTNGEYEYNYISSLEALQLLFGYLPPRKKEEYENILKKQKESLKENEIDVKKKELLDSIKDAREALSARFFKTALEAEMFLIEIKKLKLSDAKFIENSTEEEFLAEVDKFNEMLLSVLLSSGNISKENLKKARAMDPESKIKFLRSLLKDIK